MKGFFMLAGTVLTHLDLKQLAGLCTKAGMKPVFDDGEFSIDEEATLTFREGFDHELVLVGDAGDLEALQALTQRISMILAGNKIAHAYELYDPKNELVLEFDSEG